jgi:hypothetical protein
MLAGKEIVFVLWLISDGGDQVVLGSHMVGMLPLAARPTVIPQFHKICPTSIQKTEGMLDYMTLSLYSCT